MAIADETTLRIVLYEGEGAASLDAGDRGATVTALLSKVMQSPAPAQVQWRRQMLAPCSCSAGLKTVKPPRRWMQMAQ